MTKKITKKDYWLEYQIPLLRKTGNNLDKIMKVAAELEGHLKISSY